MNLRRKKMKEAEKVKLNIAEMDEWLKKEGKK
jgi:hypothetical protein